MSKNKKPEVIEDSKLDEASGGIGLLLPAVQKVRDAAVRDGTSTPVSQLGTKTIGVGELKGDGSV